MDQSMRNGRPFQLLPAKSAIIDLFNLYLGRNPRQKSEDPARESSNKMQKRVTAPIREFPPRNEQFLVDFRHLQGQFPDQDQLCAVTESVLISFIIQCSAHGPQSEFLLFALRSLCSIGYVKWDSFLPSLLSTVSSTEALANPINPTSGSPMIMSPSSSSVVIPSTSNFHTSNPTSPMPSIHGVGSPAQSITDQSISTTLSPVKPSDPTVSGQSPSSRATTPLKTMAISSLRQLVCKIVLASLNYNLKPVTHIEIFSHMVSWLVNWDQKQQNSDEPERLLHEWMHVCLDVIWNLVEENKCRIPFYELIRSELQYIDNIPDNEALFSIILEIHRRRDLVATHMQMLDQHLHCPTFATQRLLSQAHPNIQGESTANLRYSPITYPSVLGEPLHGEELAMSIKRGSLDWERALRCLRHALRTIPSPDWWRQVLLVASCYKPPQALSPG